MFIGFGAKTNIRITGYSVLLGSKPRLSYVQLSCVRIVES